nr:receptor-like protein kinase [Quercus suber]
MTLNVPQSIPFNASSAVDSVNHSEYKLPSMVMDTAVRPMNNDSLDFEVDTSDPTLEFYIYLHFAELEIIQENEQREFNINLNGNSWKESVVPLYLSSTTINSSTPVRGPKLKFSIYKTEISTLPPILNAMEVYVFKDFLQAPTDQEDAAKQLPRTHQGGRPLKSDNRQFTYSEVVSITNNFQKIVGKGGFGTVYHGCLSDGMQVAVKMLSPSSTDGSTQFLTEAQLLMRVHHRNLTSFVRYCNEGTNFGIIYEYMAYGNLAEHLSDKTRDALSWKERLQIAVDAAQGLEYLHHGCKPPIIHRDVKTANILVNEKLQAKIADFGFSKFFTEGQSHLSTAIVGTMGYLDPEYYTSNSLTERSDVYSFGIVLLELITGKRTIIKSYNKDNTNIVDWVSPLLARGDIRNIIDPRMPGNFDTNSVWKAIETAIACVPLISIQRPSMSHVVIELKECLEIEKAYEQDCGPMTKSFNDTFEVNPLGLEMDMVPEAR